MRRLGDILELKDADGELASRAIAGLAFDSRKTAPGDLFFALSGAKDDGRRHVGEALAKGAAAVVAECWTEIPDAAFVKVADANQASPTTLPTDIYGPSPEIVVDVTYTFKPTVGATWLPTMTMSRTTYMAPRNVAVVESSSGSTLAPNCVDFHGDLTRVFH